MTQGQKGQKHCIVYLTFASVYNDVALSTPPAMSQGLDINNAVKAWLVVMPTSFANGGPEAEENTQVVQ